MNRICKSEFCCKWLIYELQKKLYYSLLFFKNNKTTVGSNISSTESSVSIHIGKAWIAIDRLSTIWKSELFDKKVANGMLRKKYVYERQKDIASCFEHILEAAP